VLVVVDSWLLLLVCWCSTENLWPFSVERKNKNIKDGIGVVILLQEPTELRRRHSISFGRMILFFPLFDLGGFGSFGHKVKRD
jgi:hypothetical protein